MPEYIETRDDFRIRYADCYAALKTPPDGAASVGRLTEDWRMNNDGRVSSVAVVTFTKDKKNRSVPETRLMKLGDIRLSPLQMGAINLSRSVVVFQSKKPYSNSKYRRLPCAGNTYLIDPFSEERKHLDLRPVGDIDDYFILSAWGDNKYLPAVDALSRVMSHDRLGAAFSPEYFFGISLAGDGIYLYKFGNRIARVNTEGEVLLKPEVQWLSEELAEFGLTVKRIDK